MLLSIVKDLVGSEVKENSMEVTISVCGRFHAFYLAQQLLKRGYLYKLITSYPKFEVAKYGIPKEKVGSVVIKEFMERGWHKVPLFLKNLYNPQNLILDIYDKWASHLYNKSDICVAFAGCSLNTIRKAKDTGAITVLERGSSHMLHQTKILLEEYEKLGLKPQVAHPRIIEKELKEYEEVDYISIPSLFVKRSFLQYGIPENKLIHIPYGVHLDEFRQVKKKDNIFRIIYAGGMNLRKGVHYLLQAYSELRLPDSELLLVGGISGEIKPFFEKYDGNFRWGGHVPQSELYKYYSLGSVFVMMSIEEGLAMVQPQAMACGLPVICTTNTGGEDIVREGIDGFVIPIRDVEALKEKLTYLYENQDICEAMGQSAKERVSKGFTWDDYGEKIIEAYQKVLKNVT
jgi:glycosyltransferase involved in cell wall biosynthesis